MSGIVRDDQPPHIDPYSFVLLVGVFNDLKAYRDSEPDRERAAQMRKTAWKTWCLSMCWRTAQNVEGKSGATRHCSTPATQPWRTSSRNAPNTSYPIHSRLVRRSARSCRPS
jgi:hypothetical protein